MNQLTIDLAALQHNIGMIDSWVSCQSGARWTLVTKVLCGHPGVLTALRALGVGSMADSRLSNLAEIESLEGAIETWYLRLPHLPVIDDVVRLADVSLNSETATIEALNESARRQGKTHGIIIMIELGDLREGVLPGSLLGFYEHVFELSNISVLGIGSNLGCLSGALPTVDQLAQLSLYHELLQLKFDKRLPLISAGTSAVLPLLRDGVVPKGINHFRIGESVFLGTDLVNGGFLAGLRNDAITLDVEIVEVREKSLSPVGETTDMMPFETFNTGDHAPGRRGYRAVITVGQLDTEVRGLTPVDKRYELVGASSDLSVVNLGDNPEGLSIGDSIQFRPSYGAFVRLMLSKYIDKKLTSSAESLAAGQEESPLVQLAPTVSTIIRDIPQPKELANGN